MIKIKIPQVLKVGGFDYKILVDKKLDDELNDQGLWGQCSNKRAEIRIQSRISEQQFSATFMHEFEHAINNVYLNGALNETEVAALANGLLQVMEQLNIRFIK